MLLLVLLLGAVLLGCIYHSSTRGCIYRCYYCRVLLHPGMLSPTHSTTTPCITYWCYYYVLLLLVLHTMVLLHTTPSGCILGIRYVRTAAAPHHGITYTAYTTYIHTRYYIRVLYYWCIPYCGIPYWCITCCCATVVLHTMVYLHTASSLHSIPGGVLHTQHTYMVLHTQHILHTYRVLPTQQWYGIY